MWRNLERKFSPPSEGKLAGGLKRREDPYGKPSGRTPLSFFIEPLQSLKKGEYMTNLGKFHDAQSEPSHTSSGYSDVSYRNYLHEVEKSGILRPIRQSQKKPASTLVGVLASSRILARRHFSVCHKEMVKIFEQISLIEESIQSGSRKIQSEQSGYAEQWQSLFDNFNKALSQIFTYAQKTIIESFDTKVKRMNQFTVCLFGRTKSGKSTTMEALTHGDGKSIGKGAQNTTLDTKEYKWKDLLVVDTPGIDAMKKREELESAALTFADNADLIVFLLPHQIEEGDFDTFKRFYRQKKPLLILLNIKKEIGEVGTHKCKRFLDHPEDVFPKREILGYEQRIQTYIFQKLGIQKDLIPILPIHSRAAYLAPKAEDPVISQQLYQMSHFEQLEEQLIEEVKDYGELYRIKNPYDTVILFSALAEQQFRKVHVQFNALQELFDSNYHKFSQVELRVRQNLRTVRTKILRPFFDRQRGAIDSIVDELFEAGNDKGKCKKILKNFMPENQVREKIEQFGEDIKKTVKKEIHAFFQSFSDELWQWKINLEQPSFSFDVENLMEDKEAAEFWSGLFQYSSIFAALPLILFPPAVPAFVALFLAGLGFDFLSKKQKEKIRKKKQELREKVKRWTDQCESKVNEHLDEGLNQIFDQIKKQHVDVMLEFVAYTKKHLAQVTKVQRSLKKTTARMKKAKYQAMLRHLLDDNSMKVIEVRETKKAIYLKVILSLRYKRKGISGRVKIQTTLSRVEEKPIKLLKGGA